MRFDRIFCVSLLATTVVLSGCATSRSELRLTSPVSSRATTSNAAAPIVVIRSVKDERVFEQAPRQANIPSLGFEGATGATADAKLRAIGRKRNTYGMALGDVFLQDGQTVESVVRENLASALQDAGYNVRNAEAAGASATVIDVHIKQFWAWIHPGFWAITVNTDIVTDVTLSTSPNSIPVVVHLKDARMLVTDSAWLEAIDKALQAYRVEAAQRISAAG
jgi:hypothetical protein